MYEKKSTEKIGVDEDGKSSWEKNAEKNIRGGKKTI